MSKDQFWANSKNSTGIIPSLDGIRAISIFIVFAAHAGVSKYIPGGFGVTIFFFLSGYLITRLFTVEYIKYGFISVKAFFIRRLLRLTPVLFVTLAIVYTLIYFNAMPGEIYFSTIASQAFYYYNYLYIAHGGLPPGPGALNPLWSLAVEEHFYVLWPFVFVFLLRQRWLIPGLIALLMLILVWRGLRWWEFGWDHFSIYIATETRADSILYGALLAVIEAKGYASRLFPQTPKARAMAILGALGVLAATLLIRDSDFRNVSRYSIQGLALAPLFYYAVNYPRMLIFRPLNWPWLQRIGVYSYAIYLIHYQLVGTVIFYGVSIDATWTLFILAGLASVAYAAVLEVVLERPLRHVRKRATGH